ELEGVLGAVGINLHSIAESIDAVGGFIEAPTAGRFGGAVVIEVNNPSEARSTVTKVRLLLRAAGTKGVTAIGGKMSGFSVHSAHLGPERVIVVDTGEEVVIAYGSKALGQVLRSGTQTLGSTADFEAGKNALGSTPMSAFVDGSGALGLLR